MLNKKNYTLLLIAAHLLFPFTYFCLIKPTVAGQTMLKRLTPFRCIWDVFSCFRTQGTRQKGKRVQIKVWRTCWFTHNCSKLRIPVAVLNVPSPVMAWCQCGLVPVTANVIQEHAHASWPGLVVVTVTLSRLFGITVLQLPAYYLQITNQDGITICTVGSRYNKDLELVKPLIKLPWNGVKTEKQNKEPL